jgi:hypothetical protein
MREPEAVPSRSRRLPPTFKEMFVGADVTLVDEPEVPMAAPDVADVPPRSTRSEPVLSTSEVPAVGLVPPGPPIRALPPPVLPPVTHTPPDTCIDCLAATTTA